MKINRGFLFKIIAEKGFCYASLARKAGITPNCISNLMSGKTKRCTPDVAFRIAKALGVDILDFMIVE